MERTVRNQACDVTQLHQSINGMVRMLEAHAVREEVQWCGMNEWLRDREMNCDDRHRDDTLWGVSIIDMPPKLLANTRVSEALPTHDGRKDERIETTTHDGKCLGALQNASPMQGGKPEKRHLQQQPKPKPKMQLKQHSKQQHKPKRSRSPTLASR
jgi:hypothetical protein